MPWVRLDEGFPEHPKVLAVGGDAGWLHVCALAYCNRNLTDGFIPEYILARLSDRKKPAQLAGALVDVGMWDVVDGGWRIHDYLDYQASKAAVAEDRRKARERMANVRQRSGEHSPPVRPNKSVRSPYPSRSDTDPSSSSSSTGSSNGSHRRDEDDDRITHAIDIHARCASQTADNPGRYERTVKANDRKESVPELLRYVETHPDVTGPDLARAVFGLSVVDVRRYDPRRT